MAETVLAVLGLLKLGSPAPKPPSSDPGPRPSWGKGGTGDGALPIEPKVVRLCRGDDSGEFPQGDAPAGLSASFIEAL